jgi:hypothetical protein
MKLTKIAKVESGQDIAIFNGYLFDFVAHGVCLGEVSVYDLEKLKNAGGCEPEPLCRFILGGVEKIIPHANAVFFSDEYYKEGDEFPILYANVYNTYQKCAERHEGELLAYRIRREEFKFFAELVQVIKIGFTENLNLWKSLEGNGDLRPYGNFTFDRDSHSLYAFVMRDGPHTSRYFKFKHPSVFEGEYSDKYGARLKVLNECDIESCFDTDYHKGIQGAVVQNGKIYSLEGGLCEYPAAIRIINPESERLEFFFEFGALGVYDEPEGIDFPDGVCYYVCGEGDTYILEF